MVSNSEENFQLWITLRNDFRKAKKEKNYKDIIYYANKIIELDRKEKSIGIMVSIFLKDIGDAEYKLMNVAESIKYFELAIKSFQEYRATHKLNKPDDFLKDIQVVENKIKKVLK
jgi:hypothetical protein